MWQAWLTAMRFLTVIPVPSRWCGEADHESAQSQSLLFYPLVGLIIGGLLLIVAFVTDPFSSFLQATLMVTVWIVVTGGLHLDGVADSADAWLGGHGDRAETLRILRDTSVGMAGVVALILTILLKIVCLAELDSVEWLAVLFVPVISRTMLLVLFRTTHYVREAGLGSALTRSLPKQSINFVIVTVVVLVLLLLQVQGLVMILAVSAGFVIMRFMMVRRIGGTTGDTAGALTEFSEVSALLGLVVAEKLA